MTTTRAAVAAAVVAAVLALAGCSSYSDTENRYWEQAVSNGADVDEGTSVAIGHQACRMFAAGAGEDAVVVSVWGEGGSGASQQAAQAMVSAAHGVMCPG